MVADTRSNCVTKAHSVVVKVGTNVLADSTGRLNLERIRSLTGQIARLKKAGRKVALVSSGAVGAGLGQLQLRTRPDDLAHLQACAAVGQSALMQLYQHGLAPHGIHPAQLLLTTSDFDSRVRYLNVRNTIATLFEYGCLPIINENDTVSVAEIKFGDNDHLAALVTNLLQAPLLILLTNVDGLFSADPQSDATAKIIDTVPMIDQNVNQLAGPGHSRLGTGGMRSKLKAAQLVTGSGGSVIIANGSEDDILDRIFRGDAVGTFCPAVNGNIPAWKNWLGYTARPRGRLIIDSGAARAVISLGRSLLPVGVREVTGHFGKGDVVAVCLSDGREIARGLTNYPAHEANRIIGRNTEQMAEQLGKVPYAEIIHRDNLVLLTRDLQAEQPHVGEPSAIVPGKLLE